MSGQNHVPLRGIIHKKLTLDFINTNFSKEKSDNEFRLGVLMMPANENSRSTGADDVSGVLHNRNASFKTLYLVQISGPGSGSFK